MGEFSIIPKNVLLNVGTLKSCGTKIEKQIAYMEKVKNGISLGSSTGIIKAELSASIEKLTALEKGFQTMSEKLHNIASEYVNADIRVEDNDIKISLHEKQSNEDDDSSEDGTIDWKEIWEEIVRLAKKRVITEAEFISFRLDLEKIIFAGIDKLVSGDDTDWKEWFYEYVPNNVSDLTLLGILSFLSMLGMPQNTIDEHRENNEKAWEQYQDEHGNGKYIEDQPGMNSVQYGSHSGDYNTCEVIAAYNALQYLTNGESPDSFPELLAQFEKEGITLFGEFGTSPESVHEYFDNNGYDTKMLVGDGISTSNISNLSEDYDTYIMTTYNNGSDLSSMIHTVSITKENDVYVVHNDYEGTKSYESLDSAVSGYNNGNGEPITLIGIRE